MHRASFGGGPTGNGPLSRALRAHSDRKPLTPLAGGSKIDMDETRARIEAEPEETDCACRRLEYDRVMVRHCDIEGRAIHVLGPRRTADGAVVLGASIGRSDDQRFAQPVPQRLKLILRGFVDQHVDCH